MSNYTHSARTTEDALFWNGISLSVVQWAQAEDKDWRVSNCRMVKYVNFHGRSSKEPIANVEGLQTLTRHFLLRARTQLRPTEDMKVKFQVFSSDGFQMDVQEVGEVRAPSPLRKHLDAHSS